MSNDEFGNRMKEYEEHYTSLCVPITQILCIRIDGKNFSKFTKNFSKPFDDTISSAMIDTMKGLVKETHASIGYTQSDEITLIYTPKEKASEYLFGGKVSKINSILASMATSYFSDAMSDVYTNNRAFFDCRAWGVPNIAEASNVLLWRAQDARKNSISSVFRWTAGHSKMHGLSGEEMKAILKNEYGVDWTYFPSKYKYGSYAKPVIVQTFLTQDELEKITYKMRPDAEVVVKRTKIEELDIGFFGDLSLNYRMDIITC